MRHFIFEKIEKMIDRLDSRDAKYPCRRCFYYGACGDGGRTKPCKDRLTSREAKKKGKQRYQF